MNLHEMIIIIIIYFYDNINDLSEICPAGDYNEHTISLKPKHFFLHKTENR